MNNLVLPPGVVVAWYYGAGSGRSIITTDKDWGDGHIYIPSSKTPAVGIRLT